MKYVVPLSWSLYAAFNAKLSVHLWHTGDHVWSLGLIIPIIICIYMIRSTFAQVKTRT